MRLFDLLANRYHIKRDIMDKAMDFRTLFLDKCQKTFEDQENEDFFVRMPKNMDEDEKMYKKKERIFGNMKLIGIFSGF
jgi:hypothetical protein